MLIPCPACSRQVSRAAPACPGCGHPIAQPGFQPDRHDIPTPTAALNELAVSPPATVPTPKRQHAATTRPKARDIPGSIPAAVLSLLEAALVIVSNAIQHGSAGSPLPGLIVGLGLLFGGPGFRDWGVFTNIAGLGLMPILLLCGMFGGPTAANFVGLAYNAGILLLLVGTPTRARVRWGVATCIGTLLMVVAIGTVTALEQGPPAGGGAGGPLQPGTYSGERATNPRDGAEMVWVPPGEFQMGYPDQMPIHRVRLTHGFWLYETEVTNRQYARFLAGSWLHRKPLYWKDVDLNQPEQPVVGVSWKDANDYCRWAGVRLPTEAEWEYAARGTDGRMYPWGNQSPISTRAVSYNPANTPIHRTAASRVGSLPAGASPFGALDMAGNVWEWCADWYAPYSDAPQMDPAGPPNGTVRVFRGGAWDIYSECGRTEFRIATVPSERGKNMGFRPARN